MTVVPPDALAAATTPRCVAEGVYETTLSPQFHNLNGVPQGGYVLSVALGAALEATGRPHVVTASAHYPRPVDAGSCSLEVDIVRSGWQYDVVEVRLLQADAVRTVVMATLGDLDARSGLSHHPSMPPFPSLHPGAQPIDTPISKHFSLELEEDHSGFLEGRPRDQAVSHSRVSRSDPQQRLTILDLPVLADWRSPGPFLVGLFGLIPTVELDLHVIAPPPYPTLRRQLVLESLQNGIAIETMRFWNDDDQLVATARQLILHRVRRAGSG